MKRLIFLPVIALLFLFSCSHPQTGLLNTSNLKSSSTTIDPGKDNDLKTPGGAIIKIAANSFDVAAGAKVNIEIKEAYSMQDILKAGLITMSNGKPLQSGGMIYFNATADNKPVKYLKPVGITIPSKTYNESMQVFKGEISDGGSINWTTPQKPDTSAEAKRLIVGKALFQANCASCHKPYQETTGPMLAGCRDREPNKEWAYKFTNNVNVMLEYDSYARSLWAKYGSKMTQFNLRAQEIKDILDYCDNEAWLYKPELFQKNAYDLPADTSRDGTYINRDCGYDTLPVYEEPAIEFIQEDTLLNDTTMIFNNAPERPMYSFTIDQSGWYNIDCFIDNNINLVSDAILTATVKNGEDKILDVYLCMPSKKLLADGYEEEGKYIFNEAGGKIKLIKGTEAFVYVLGLKEKKFYYGISKFVVKDEQHLIIDLKESSKEDILNELRRNKIGNTVIDREKPVVEKFINADPPGNSTNNPDSLPVIKEMQIIKNPCTSADSTSATAIAKH